ncbi:DUF3014 domain-containing protein [Wenzhouxiangella sediminis]|uniref:DUF3014 domain-containing protein n=1 Tax=Wenzhouxiangella sediminis TaxID=1792836 RepID=A0A3E1KBG4_9GAMM|nr:DUF3014 domain-containing protein [Wenzhouxiangella sediminis]RFF31256.1 DUF3014 domain-containing protein [Wenzhouxiangella sediminis]
MRWFISALVVLALVGGLWWVEQRQQAELTPDPATDLPSEPEDPQPRYPLPKPELHPAPAIEDQVADDTEGRTEEPIEPESEPRPPLPELADSDESATGALSDSLGNDFVDKWIKPEFVISRTVAVVNNLDGSAPALKTWPLRPLGSEPITQQRGNGDTLLWTAANAERYTELVDALDALPPEQAADLYARYYPLFQQAWEELGENEPYFNDRLIDVIDHLLATPEVALPFEVVPYESRLHFADEALQKETWGRKLLMRMGAAQAGMAKEWLRNFRNAVVEATDPPAP